MPDIEQYPTTVNDYELEINFINRALCKRLNIPFL